MKIILDIPDDVWRLVEYIPEEMLPSILLDIIRENIMARSSYKASSEEVVRNSADIKQLMTMIQDLTTGGVIHTKAEVKKEESKPVEAKKPKKVQIVADISDDEDLDDFADMMK